MSEVSGWGYGGAATEPIPQEREYHRDIQFALPILPLETEIFALGKDCSGRIVDTVARVVGKRIVVGSR